MTQQISRCQSDKVKLVMRRSLILPLLTQQVARFLKGLPMRAVGADAPNRPHLIPRLILATETDLSAQVVVEIYASGGVSSPFPVGGR